MLAWKLAYTVRGCESAGFDDDAAGAGCPVETGGTAARDHRDGDHCRDDHGIDNQSITV